MQDYNNFYDVVIVGAGPAGLSAAIYMARAKYKVLVLEKDKIGGQITITEEVVNYPGVFKTSGEELTHNMYKQARSFGAEFQIAEVLNLELKGDIKTIQTTRGEFKALGVILALGANPRKLGFKGETDFSGRGVAYCATCDGEFFTDKDIYVVGGGFAAVEEGVFLTKYAKKVHMIVREPEFTCAKTVGDKAVNNSKIDITYNTEVVSVEGETALTKLTVVNNQTNEQTVFEHQDGMGVFIFAGYTPNTKWLTNDVEKTSSGYIITDANQKTNIAGVYAAGDVCVKELRQVVTAVSDGASASTSLEKHVENMHSVLKIPAFEINKAAVKEEVKQTSTASEEDGFFTAEIKSKLADVFDKFERNITIKAFLDDSDLAARMSEFLAEFSPLCEKISYEKVVVKDKISADHYPYFEIYTDADKPSGVIYKGVPSGHDFNAFIIGLYNVASAGQAIDTETMDRIKKIDKKINIQVLISMSCTICPTVIMGTQRVASLSDNIRAEMVDLMYFPNLKEQYNVMSVPCMVVNGKVASFGKKNVNEIVDILEKS